MKIADIAETLISWGVTDNVMALAKVIAEKIESAIPANMEVPALEDCAGPLSIERRNLILGRNAGLDECRKAMGVKNDR